MKLKDYKKNIPFCFLMVSTFVFGQTTLKVVDNETKKPIKDAEIYKGYNAFLGKTNTEGIFLVTAEEQDIEITIVSDFYDILDVSILKNQENKIELYPILNEVTEVIYTARAKRIFGLKRLKDIEGTSIYAGKKNEVILLENALINKASNNARQIYAQVSGLNIYDNNDGGLQLNIGGRGLDPNRTASFNTRQNGYDISADVLGYPESYYTPPAEAIQEIQVLRGAASLQYGTQFGGLVNFKLKTPVKNKPIQLETRQTLGSYGLFSSFNSLSGTVGGFSYYTYFNYKEGDGFRQNSNYSSRNGFAQVNYQLSEKTKLSTEVSILNYLAKQAGGLTDVQFYEDSNFSNRSRNWFKVDWKLYNAKLEHQFNKNNKLSVSVFGLDASRKAVGFRTHRVSQVEDLDGPRDLLVGKFLNYGLESRWLHQYQIKNKKSALLVGMKYYKSKNTSLQGPGSKSYVPDFSIDNDFTETYPNQSNFVFPNENIALFTENIFYVTPKLSVTPGIRFENIKTKSDGTFKVINTDLAGNVLESVNFEDNRTFNRNLILYGLGVSYKPNKNLELISNFSKNYRSVTFNDIRVNNPSFQIDTNITDEKGFTFDIGTRGNYNKIWNYDMSVFSILYDNRLGEVLKAETAVNSQGEEYETGRVIRFRGNIGTAILYGLESTIEWNINRDILGDRKDIQFNWFANASIIDSKYTQSDIPNVENRKVEFIPTLNLKTGLNFGYKNFRSSLQFTHLGRQFTDATNAPQDSSDSVSGIQGAIPSYSVVDLSLGYTYNRFKIESGINNLFNTNYFTRRATGYPGPGIIPAEPLTWYTTLAFKW